MWDLYIAGGVNFMTPITLMLLVVLVLGGLLVYRHFTGRGITDRHVDAIRQTGMLALAWGVFSTVLGFFQALHVLSGLKESLPFYVIMGGIKVALITSLYGMIVFLFAFALSIVMQWLMKKRTSG